jgi:hypothetical protein
MKKNTKTEINSEKLLKNEDLISLKGGTELLPNTYNCYKYGSMGGCTNLITGFGTTDCDTAWDVCSNTYHGACVEGPGCNS